jgi:large conductance mechanosensitive channel
VLKEFKEFIAKGNVIDLAVAVVIGAAFALIVTAFVNGILMPIIGIVGGKPTFDDYTVTVNNSIIRYGTFISALVNFLIIAFAVFLVVKAINKMQAMRKTEEEKEEELDEEVLLLTEIRDLLRAEAASSGASPS